MDFANLEHRPTKETPAKKLSRTQAPPAQGVGEAPIEYSRRYVPLVGYGSNLSTESPEKQKNQSASLEIQGKATGNKLDLPKGHNKKYSYKKIPGKAFVKGSGDSREIDSNDVTQGQLGDCYLIAPLKAIARTNPGLIRKMIKDNANGTFDVTLNGKVFKVENTFPTDANGDPAYAHGGDKDKKGNPELWGMLIEKAYAMSKGGYGKTEYGYAANAMKAITGKEAEVSNTENIDSHDMVGMIQNQLSKGYAMTAATGKSSDFLFLHDTNGWKKEADKVDAVPTHQYIITGVNASTQTIDLENPWGRQHLKGLPILTFKKLFTRFEGVNTKMKKLFFICILFFLIAQCKIVPQVSSYPRENMENIKETTVGLLEGTRVGVGAIWERSYNLPDGTSHIRMTAKLFPFDRDEKEKGLIVGKGSIITIGKTKWQVISVEKKSPEIPGEVILKKFNH